MSDGHTHDLSKYTFMDRPVWKYVMEMLGLEVGPQNSYYPGLGFHYAPVPLEVSVGHVQTISTGVGQAFLQLVLPLIYHVYHRFELDPFLYDRKSNAKDEFSRHLSIEHVVFS